MKRKDMSKEGNEDTSSFFNAYRSQMVYYLYNKGNKMKERGSEIKRKGKGMKRQAAFLMFKERR